MLFRLPLVVRGIVVYPLYEEMKLDVGDLLCVECNALRQRLKAESLVQSNSQTLFPFRHSRRRHARVGAAAARDAYGFV